METNTELLNRIEAHIKGLRADCAAQTHLTPSDIDQEAAKKYADEQLAGHNRELAESGHTRHFKMGYVCFAGY